MNSKLFNLKKFLHTTEALKRSSLLRCRALSSSSSDEKIIKSPAPFCELPKGNFVKTVFKNFDKYWSKIALECSHTERKVTYSELQEQTAKWSAYLRQRGIGKGDTISLISPNCIQFPPILFGTASVGASFSPINAKFTANEIRRMVMVSKAKIIVFTRELESLIVNALAEDIKNYELLSIGEPKDLNVKNVDDILYGDESAPPFTFEEVEGTEIVYIPFSSGTTGPPKAVMTDHNSLAANIMIYTNPYHEILWEPEGTIQKVQLGMLPFFHIYGLVAILSTGLYSGAKTVVMANFTPEFFIQTLIKHKINYLHTVPTLLNLLNYSPSCTSETLNHVNSVICGAAPVLRPSVEFLRKKIKKDIVFYEGYGMTEVGITHVSPKRFQHSVGCGHLVSNVEARVISTETGAPLGPNEVGEICIRSPALMHGYMDNPAATEDFIRNGWAHTGDIGYYDNDEFFFVVDRTKDLIKVHSLQVSPSEIEEELIKHPSVAECSVIGIPDDITGEAPFAFIILKQDTTEQDIQSFLENKLAKHKQLRGGMKFVDTLPKSDTGKVLRRQLRTMVK